MFIVTFDSADVKPAALVRPFASGLAAVPSVVKPARRGPSAADLAFEAGRSIALDCEGPVEPPARYTPAERSAFLAGLAEGAAIAHARELAHLDDLAMKAGADELLSDGVPNW
jgi:hypothetical protein